MPRKVTGDDELKRRRRRGAAAAAAAEIESERGLLMRLFLRSPKDMVAGLLAFTAAGAIITNALFLQTGPHPAPMFGSLVVMHAASSSAASPLPRPRPVEAEALLSDSRLTETPLPEPRPILEPRASEPRASEPKPAEPKPAEPKSADPLTNLVKATSTSSIAPPGVVRPQAPIPLQSAQSTGSRRVAAVQRVLTEYGYGQLKPTGTLGPDTQAAIQRFERERRMPVTGQMSERLVHELAAVIGHPID